MVYSILYIMLYTMIYIKVYCIHTSGAIRSRRTKGRVRSRIRTRSPVRCIIVVFPVPSAALRHIVS